MGQVSGRAEIEARLTHVEEVVSGLKQIGGSVDQVATKAGKVESGFKKVAGSLVDVARVGLTAAGVLQAFDIAKGVEQVKQLDASTARWGRSAGISGDILKKSMTEIEARAGTGADRITAVGIALGRATYDGKAAAGAMADLADYALATGENIEDTGGIFEAMRTGLGVTSKFGDELGRVRAIAEDVGTVGGPRALIDTLAGLTPALRTVSAESDAARAKLESFIAVIGKGRSKEQAQGVAGGALAMLQARALDIERLSGQRVLDDQGRVMDPGKQLAWIQANMKKKFGGRKDAMRRAAISEWGAELGTAILNYDANAVSQAAGATGPGFGSDAEDVRATDEYKREQRRVNRDAELRDKAAGPLAAAGDAITETLGPWGTLAAGVLGPKALDWVKTKGLNKLFAKGAAKAAAGAGAAAAEGGATAEAAAAGASGLGLASAAAASTGLAQLYAVSQLGEDRDTMGAKWRNKQAPTIGAELAQQAVKAGDLMPVIGKAGGDKEVIAAMLAMLEARLGELPDKLGRQVSAGIASEFRRAPLVVQQRPNPNTPPAAAGN